MNIKELLRRDRIRLMESQKEYEEILRSRYEDAVRKRQQSEEIEKRAVDELAQRDDNTVEHSEDSSNETKSGVQQAVGLQALLYSKPKPKKEQQEYPHYEFDKEFKLPTADDFASAINTYDPKTLRVNWGQTIGEQKKIIQSGRPQDVPKEDITYYDQLHETYLSKLKDYSEGQVPGSPGEGSVVFTPNRLKNPVILWNMNKNDGEIKGYAGQIDQRTELRKYLQDVLDYSDLIEKLAVAKKDYEDTQSPNLLAFINDILKNRLPVAKQKADIAKTYIGDYALREKPTTYWSPSGVPVTINTGDKNLSSETISSLMKSLGTYSEMPDSNLQEIQKLKANLDEIVSKKNKSFDYQDDDARDGMLKNMYELAKWKKIGVDPEYMKKYEEASKDLNFLDLDTYYYALPGLLGSSAAFNGIQYANMALSSIGAKLSTTGYGALIGVPMIAAGFTLGIESGKMENAIETADAIEGVFRDNLVKSGEIENFVNDASKKLGKKVTYEEAVQAMTLGSFEPLEKHKDIFSQSSMGLHNLFMRDMMATTFDNVVETAVSVIPYGRLFGSAVLKPGEKFAKLRRLSEFSKAHPKAFEAMQKGQKAYTATKDALTGAGFGVGSVVSMPLGLATAGITKAVSPLAKKVGKAVSENIIKRFIDLGELAKIMPKTIMTTKVAGKSAGKWLSGILSTMVSEGIEEGKQYYNQKQYAAGNYAGEADSIFDILLGDIEGGSKSALQFANNYLPFLGMTPDKEWITNIKGGILAGGGHTAVMTAYGHGESAYKLISIQDMLWNNIQATKAQERMDIEKAKAYAKHATFNDRKHIDEAFDNIVQMQKLVNEKDMQENDGQLVNGVSEDVIEEQRQVYNRIFNLANSQGVRQDAERLGIEVGSDRFNTYVALRDFFNQEAKNSLESSNSKVNGIKNLISQHLFNVDNIENLSDDQILALTQQLGIETKRSSRPIFDDKAIEENRQNRRNALLNRIAIVDYISHLDALLTYRDQLRLKDNRTSAESRKLKSIEKQIKRLQDSVKDVVEEEVTDNETGEVKTIKKLKDNILSSINSPSKLQKYIFDLDLHQVARDQYRDYINFMIDYDNAIAGLYNLHGRDEKDADAIRLDNQQIVDILDAVGADLQNQYSALEKVNDNSNVSIKDGVSINRTVDEKGRRRANKVIDQYLDAIKSDEQLVQELHDDLENAFKELYEPKEETIESPEVVEEPVPVTPKKKEKEQKEKKEVVKEEKKPKTLADIKKKTNKNDKQNKQTQEERYNVNYSDYSDNFSFLDFTSDEILQMSANTVNDIVDVLNKLRDLIEKYNKWAENKKLDKIKLYKEFIKKYEKLEEEAVRLRSIAEQEIQYQVDLDDEPIQTETPIITNQDIEDSKKSNEEMFENKVGNILYGRMLELLQFIQLYLDNKDQIPEDVAIRITQAISDVDNIFNDIEQTKKYLDIYGWYFGDGIHTPRREQILDILGVRNEDLPAESKVILTIKKEKPVAPVTAEQPTSGRGAKFDDTSINDLADWNLLTNTTWEDKRYNGEDIVNSHSQSDSSIKLIDVINEPEFVNEAVFQLILKGGKNNDQPFVIVHYKGHTFTPVFIQTANNQNKNRGSKFWNLIKNSLENLPQDKMVVASKVIRSLGKERRTNKDGSERVPTTLEKAGLITKDNMYILEFSPNQDTFAFTETIWTDEGPIVSAYIPNSTGTGNTQIYNYNDKDKHGDHPGSGLPVMLIDRKFDEYGERQSTKVPINLLMTKINQGDAQLVLEIMKGKHCANKMAYGAAMLNEEYVQEDENGNIISYGISNRDVLRMLIRYGADAYDRDRRRIHLEFNQQDNRKVRIVGVFDGGDNFNPNSPDHIPFREFDLFNDNEAEAFMKMLTDHVYRRFDTDVASYRVGDQFSDDSNPFFRLNKKRLQSLQLQKMLSNGGTIRFGNSSIEFDLQDFEEPNNPDSKGVNGMVWYCRHGLLLTQYNGFDFTTLIFDEDAGVNIVDKDQKQEKSAISNAIEQNNEITKEAEENKDKERNIAPAEEQEPILKPVNKPKAPTEVSKNDKLWKLEETFAEESESIGFEQAKQRILDILGDKYFEVQEMHKGMTRDQVKNLFANGPVSFGACSDMLIEMSRFARKGTEYHEIFHAVCEYLIDDNLRNKVYEDYAKAYHIKLKNNKGEYIIKNLKRITEGLADEYQLYVMNRPTIKITLNIKKMFKSLIEWGKFFIKMNTSTRYKLYKDISNRKYKNIKPSKENIERTERLLKAYRQQKLYFQIGGKDMLSIRNTRHYRALCDGLMYILYQSQPNIDYAGRNIQEFKVDDPNIIREYPLFKEAVKKEPGLNEMLDNWDVVKKDIISKIQNLGAKYEGSNDSEQNIEDSQGDEESVQNGGFGEYTKQSWEFSQFSRAGQKVKHFFSIIPNIKYTYDKDGNQIIVYVENMAGLPTFVDGQLMYNIILNQVYNCRSLEELLSKLESIGKYNAQFNVVYHRLENLRESAGKGNVDDAALLTQICVNLHANKSHHVLCKATRTLNGKFDLHIQSTDDGYSAKNYRNTWSKSFAGGASSYLVRDADGNYKMNDKFTSKVFKTIGSFFKNFQFAVSPAGIQSIGDKTKNQFGFYVEEDGKIVYKNIDVTNPGDLLLAKLNLITGLNKLGIMFTMDMLDYTLNTKYGSTGYDALNQFFTEDRRNDLSTFGLFISGFDNNGKLNIEKTELGYSINSIPINVVFNGKYTGFVGKLADCAYQYKKSQDQLSVLGNKNNKIHLISENNYLTDTVDDLNSSLEGNTAKLDDLKSYSYNWFRTPSGEICGSIILKTYNSDKPKKLRIVTDAGFKTDSKGDIGQDYSEISQVQDECSKIQMLLEGKMIFPTMSDKKTWGYIEGVNLPGLNLSVDFAKQQLNTVMVNENGSYVFFQNDAVLNQLREYAIMEHETVLQTLKDIRGSEGNSPIAEKDKVQNYHKAKVRVKGKTYYIIQGARYSTMYAIYNSKGKKISFNRVCDADGKFISEEDNIKVAAEHFFGVPSDNEGMFWVYDETDNKVEVDREALIKILKIKIQRSLQLQLRKQLEKAAELGIIEKIEGESSYIYGFKNRLLSNTTIQKIKDSLSKDLTDQQRESLAVAIVLNDVSCKSIMSLQETERIFSGHPAFYKWKYNKNGVLSDRSTDQYKRFGGLVSTGQNNTYVFKNLPTKYTCAEVNDVEVQSEFAQEIADNTYKCLIQDIYIKKQLKALDINMTSNEEDAAKIVLQVENMSNEDIESKLDDYELKIAKKQAKDKSDKFFKDKEQNLSGVNVADGASYISDTMCENLLKQVGAYSTEIERAFKVLRGEEVDGRKYTTKDVREMITAYQLILTTVIGTQKYTAYGFRKNNGVLVPYYNKTALFPLFKSIAHGKTAKLYAKMKKESIDMIMLTSAVKIGSLGSQELDWDNIENGPKFNTYEQEYKYLRKQFNTDPDGKELRQMGTQMTKLVMLSLIPGRSYSILNPDGATTKLTSEQVRDRMMNCYSMLAKLGYKDLKERIFDGDKLNIVKFSKFLTEELQNRGASREMLDAVSVVDENTDNIDDARREQLKLTGPQLKVPLAALQGINWIQSIINSQVNKSVIDINTPGSAFIQRSILGMEGVTESTAITNEDLPSDLYEGKTLKVRNENGSMDCILSIDFFENIIPEGLSFAEARQWLIDNKIISGRMSNGEWNDADASIVCYRIPTQALSSIHAIRCVDVLETVNHTVVLPKEITTITGSDFDIDKMFLSTFFYDVEDGKVSKEFEKGSKKQYVNELISLQLSLLRDDRTIHIGDGPVDTDTQLLSKIKDDLFPESSEDLDVYDSYSLWNNTEARDLFITGKFGIGPFALNNNNHILTTLYGVKFKYNESSILSILDKNSLCEYNDMYGDSIMSWLSGLINAHVDIAKDPFIGKLNVNKYTYNLVNLLIRTGFGKMTFYFMAQPLMKQLAIRVNEAESSFGQDSNKGLFKRREEAENKCITEFAKTHLNIEGKTASEVVDKFKEKLNRLGTSKSALYKSLFDKNSDIFRQIIKQGNNLDKQFNIELENGHVLLSGAELQMVAYMAKTEFDEYAQGLSSLVKYCKIDTKKQGKNLSEQHSFSKGYKNLFDNKKSKIHTLFDEQSLIKLNEQSYIETKTKLATGLFRSILNNLIIEGAGGFNFIVDEILEMMPTFGEEISSDLINKISNAVMTAKRSTYFNRYCDANEIDIKGLISGNNTIYDRLHRLKVAIISDDRYKDLRNSDGTINNYLLNSLIGGFTHEELNTKLHKEQIIPLVLNDTYPDAKFLQTMTFMDDDSIDQDEMTLAWEELLEDVEHPELQQFARDLILYSFYTSGGNGGSNNIFKYVPISWLINPDNKGYTSSYAYYMLSVLQQMNSTIHLDSNLIEDVFLNNWTDNSFVPTVKISDGFQCYYSGRSYIDVDAKGKTLEKQTDIPIIMRCDSLVSSDPYIKINRNCDKDSQRSVAVYKRMSIEKKEQNDGTTANVVTYVLVTPKGQNFHGRDRIYEYGRYDSNITEQEYNLSLNSKLIDFAVVLGADKTNIEDLIHKIVQFVESKDTIKEGLDIIKSSGINGVLYDTIYDLTSFVENRNQTDDNDILSVFDNYNNDGTLKDSNNSKNGVSEEEAWKQSAVKELIEHLIAQGLPVKFRADMEKYFKDHPNYFIQQALEEQHEMADIKAKAIADGTFMKAPNGKDTNLNERQWLQVRTKAFKDWFGDWEKVVKLDKEYNADGITNAEFAFSGEDFVDKLITNKQWSEIGYAIKDRVYNLSKIKFYYADFSTNTPGIYGHDNIIYLNRNTHSGKTQLHEFIHAITAIEYENNPKFKEQIDELYLIAVNDESWGKKSLENNVFYSNDIYGYKSPKEFLAEAFSNREFANILGRIPYNSKKSIWQKFTDILKKLFGNVRKSTVFDSVINSIFEYAKVNDSIRNNVSKVVDENGEPLVVYHGTTSHFTTFSKEALGKFTGSKSAKLAFFTASNEEMSRDIYARLESNQHFLERMRRDVDPNFTEEDLGIGPEEPSVIDRVYEEFSEYYRDLDFEYKDVLEELEKHRPTHKKTITTTISKGEEWVTDMGLDDYVKEGYKVSQEQREEYEKGKYVTITKEIDSYDSIKKEDAAKILGTERSKEYSKKLIELDRDMEKAVEKEEKENLDSYSNRVKALFLNIRSPKVDSDFNKQYRAETYAKRVQDAINNNNDGGVIRDTRDPYRTDVYYFFEPNQAKSATHNNGMFSTENDDIQMAIGKISLANLESERLDLFTTPDGKIFGFVDKEGNIYLDETIISPEHPIHEYTHLWDRVVAKRNPKLWKRGIELMKNSNIKLENGKTLWQDVEEDSNYGGRWQHIKDTNPSKYESLIASEVHSKITGKDGLKLLNEVAKKKGAKGIVAKLKEWMLDVWKELKATFSNWSKEDLDKLTLEDFVQMTMRDFTDGINLNQEINNIMEDESIPQMFIEDIHGNNYGWSIESIYNHLKKFVEDNPGVTETEKRKHIIDVNTTYGTNFGIYERNGRLIVKQNEVDENELKLSENPITKIENINVKDFDLYDLIINEPSVESAESLLNDYTGVYSQEEIEDALGKYIRDHCNNK